MPKTFTEAELYHLFYDGDPQAIWGFILRLTKHFHIADPPNVLDVGAGTGRFLELFRAMHWTVTGAEPYREYANALRQRFANDPSVTITDEGFQDLAYNARFDMVLSLNGPFCYLLSAEERELAVSRAFAALKPNGILLIDTSNFPWILKHYREPATETKVVAGCTIERRATHAFDFHDNIMTHTDLFMVDGVAQAQTVHRFYLLGFPEIETLLCRHGFSRITTYPDYSAVSPGRITGKRMLIVGQKA